MPGAGQLVTKELIGDCGETIDAAKAVLKGGIGVVMRMLSYGLKTI